MDYTHVLGNTNELKCILAFMQLGYHCSIPYGNEARYDFIVDLNGKLLRIQCKNSHNPTSRGEIKTDCITFSTVSATINTKETIKKAYTSEEIDYFATSFNDKVYVIPVEECSQGTKTLRFSPPNNGNLNYCHAEDYEISKRFEINPEYIQSEINYKSRDTSKKDENGNSIKKNEHVCLKCGKPVAKQDSLCVECAQLESRKVERPDRETFKNLIRNKSFCEIGRMYNLSDNAIHKWCKSYGLPSRKSEINKIDQEIWNNL